MKVSLPGKSVYSTEPRDFAFNSKYGSVKIYKQSPNKTYETVVVAKETAETVTISHNLGFIPLCMLYTELVPGSGRWYNGVASGSPNDVSGQIYIDNLYGVRGGTYADTTNLYITFINYLLTNLTVKYYYFIFGDAGS